jgi:drug/metabolite transporter (DMT)-like permease
MEKQLKHETEIQLRESLSKSSRDLREINAKKASSTKVIKKISIDLLKEDSFKTPELPLPSPSPHLSEKTAFLVFLLSNIIFGLGAFHIKFISKQYPNDFNSNGFLVWRSLGLWTLGIFMIKAKTNEHIIKIWEVKNKFWFIVRTAGNYFAVMFFVLSMMELRAATVSCISAMHPILVLVFSIIILKDKFYIRYLFGLLLCFSGAVLIIGNEKKPPQPHIEDIITPFDDEIAPIVDIASSEMDVLRFIRGIAFGGFHLILLALVVIGLKVIAVEKISANVQCLYLGLINMSIGFVSHCLHPMFRVSFNPGFVFACYCNGGSFFLGTTLYVEAIKGVSINKVSPLSYFGTLTVFFMGVVVMGEPVFLTDMIGSSLIIAFNAYNSLVPLK